MSLTKVHLKAAVVIEHFIGMVKDVDTSRDVIALKSTTEQSDEFYKVIGMTGWETNDNLPGLDDNDCCCRDRSHG